MCKSTHVDSTTPSFSQPPLFFHRSSSVVHQRPLPSVLWVQQHLDYQYQYTICQPHLTGARARETERVRQKKIIDRWSSLCFLMVWALVKGSSIGCINLHVWASYLFLFFILPHCLSGCWGQVIDFNSDIREVQAPWISLQFKMCWRWRREAVDTTELCFIK